MVGNVLIKSYNRGLSIHLNPDCDMEVLKKDLADTFRESASFFKDATVAISFEDREVDAATEIELLNIITANSDLKIACVAGRNKLTQKLIVNALNEIEYRSENNIDSEVQVVHESVKDGHILEVPGSVLILGDVYNGSSVTAGGDIYVFGALHGQAYAGNYGDEKRVVAALDLNPEKLRIAGIRYKTTEKPKWTIKPKQAPTPRIATFDGSNIVFTPLDAGFWKKFYLEENNQK